MDLTQRKLNKSEWESIEVPVSESEKAVLQLIISGTENVNIKYNPAISLLSFLKVENNSEMEDYLFVKYFDETVKKVKASCICPVNSLNNSVSGVPKIKKADMIRLERNEVGKIPPVYECLLLETVEKLLKNKSATNKNWLLHYFTLYKLNKNTITNVNRHVKNIVNNILTEFEEEIDMVYMIENAVTYIEKNELLLKNADMMLYEHQKEIFTVMKNPHFKQRLANFRIEMDKDLSDDDDDVTETVFIRDTSIPTPAPKLVLYIAPTGTGKTLTPLGISQQYRVIFVCAARHVGLALAKAAISVGKKIAFAFGCSSADDIRLHYFAAKEYKKNRKSGGIGKVDNSIGNKVEIMICDVRSYLCAMYYMLAFNPAENLVTYWDEPTITMDRESHDLHASINKNWTENLIPNVILSSATLPKLHELPNTVRHFNEKFPGAQVHNIVSHDCKKSIPIISKNGHIVLPHFLSECYDTIKEIVGHCEKNLTLLRYFDLEEVVKFIIFIEKNSLFTTTSSKIDRNFASLDDVNMQNIKLHYLKLLGRIKSGTWGSIYLTLTINRKKRILSNDHVDEKGNVLKKVSSVGPGTYSASISSTNSGKPLSKMMSEQVLPSNVYASSVEKDVGNCAIYVSTKDAYTLTDGPTIFLAEDVEKIARFCIQQANIPAKAMEAILEKIEFNNRVNEKIGDLEKQLECLEEKNSTKVLETDGGAKYGGKNYSKKDDGKKKDFGSNENNKEVAKINSDLDTLRSMIKPAELNETFVPNKTLHLKKWAEALNASSAFTSDIDEQTIVEIMMLKNVADSWKILLLMGIGVFTNHPDITYTEIMKKLADHQKLYMIIASSDYIYGTNYQFCHGYLSKDLTLTQEKMVQALGRIGRSNIQQTYSVRLRDDEQIKKLFYEELDKPEVRNMNALFG
ncbi:MAG: hypothetical protein EBY20_00700 [Alphaproteobacteria bacterium]|uniref:Uncharacterized protein n=1 Tax=viral metagenome TaxID=1070528 RepID=A0A6C0HSC6_9ZZZZ|nr:hypothetical protein [Alphaproteobacteria bacterium]